MVFTDPIENVPAEYREVGLTINMRNDKNQTRNLILTRVDDRTVTVDGNNPLRGRNVMLTIGVLAARNAIHEEINCGGAVGYDPDINEILR
jgi:FKBP-type peptidyl-prolyl cis-trans isomerase SlyD